MKPPQLKSYALSDMGLSRSNNEDAWLSLPEIGFFALADGMGGHQGGEIAAKETLAYLAQFAKEIKTRDPVELLIEIRFAIEKANRRVHQMGKTVSELQGMGTTLCCLILAKGAVVCAHVGDSRIYRFRSGKLKQLTQDNSFLAKWLSLSKLAEKCETPYPYRNVITRAIGGAGKANPEIAVESLLPNDLFLLCSDGLSDVLTLAEMEQIFYTPSATLQESAEKLIEKAKFKGGPDNMTALIIQVEADGQNLSRS